MYSGPPGPRPSATARCRRAGDHQLRPRHRRLWSGSQGRPHWEAEELVLESDRPILAGLDGEALAFDSPLTLKIVPKGLRVLVPRGTKPGYIPPVETIAAQLIGVNLLAGLDEQPDE